MHTIKERLTEIENDIKRIDGDILLNRQEVNSDLHLLHDQCAEIRKIIVKLAETCNRVNSAVKNNVDKISECLLSQAEREKHT